MFGTPGDRAGRKRPLDIRESVHVILASNSAWPVPYDPSRIIAMEIEGWGAGGSGAGSDTTSTQRTAGGGSGAYFFRLVTRNFDRFLNITIGAGGIAKAAAAGGAAGNAGGTTTVVGTILGTLSATGGGGGATVTGGSPGTASGGDENLIGQDGGIRPVAVAAGLGVGGASPRGGLGGQGNVGSAGQVPGGGGACSNHTGTGDLSGAGGNGQVRIKIRYRA